MRPHACRDESVFRIQCANGDKVLGGDGNDTIYGGSGDDLLDGSLGNDNLFGEAGQDTLLGNAGIDTLGAASKGQGDANADGNVDAEDLAVWQTEFGTTSPLSAVNTVPEPATIILILLATLGMQGLRVH